MRNMASKLVQGRDGQAPLIPINVFVGIGNLAFEQLSTLRHRGAFSTVSSTFARCCQLAQGQVFMNGATGQNPIEQWYQVCYISERKGITVLIIIGSLGLYFSTKIYHAPFSRYPGFDDRHHVFQCTNTSLRRRDGRLKVNFKDSSKTLNDRSNELASSSCYQLPQRSVQERDFGQEIRWPPCRMSGARGRRS